MVHLLLDHNIKTIILYPWDHMYVGVKRHSYSASDRIQSIKRKNDFIWQMCVSEIILEICYNYNFAFICY